MRFVSTRGNTPAVGLSAALNAGLAPDGGLYVPEWMPATDDADFVNAQSLPEIAQAVLKPFFDEDPLAAELPAICAEAFNFPLRLRSLPANLGLPAERRMSAVPLNFVLELFHGPTAAFKDFGARFLAASLRRIPRHDSRPLTILVATSGDTGSAVAAAFHKLPGFRVVILYPDGRVSPRQAHQLGCFGDNILALKIDGTFDDCQRLVKQAFNDTELREQVPLSSANSISLGRLLPQMCYYAKAALDHQRKYARNLSFVVPTGNLGNAVACLLARGVSSGIGNVALATNANKTLVDFSTTGHYRPRPAIATIANAMDVGDPSNFERLRWIYPNDDELRAALPITSIDDDAIRHAIRHGRQRYNNVWCPHTATAVVLLEQARANDSDDWAIVSTAHPAKFDTIVEPLIGAAIPVPESLSRLLQRPAHAETAGLDYAQFRARLAR